MANPLAQLKTKPKILTGISTPLLFLLILGGVVVYILGHHDEFPLAPFPFSGARAVEKVEECASFEPLLCLVGP